MDFSTRSLLFVSLVLTAGLAHGNGPESVSVDKGVKMIKNLFYTKDQDQSHSLDLYLPETDTGGKRLPLMVLIHGGGWHAGDKKDFSGPAKDFVRRGYAAASINYRLLDNVFPAPVLDCKAAVRWLRGHAAQYDLDPERFAVTGHSAGGHLAAFLAVTNGLKEFDQGENLGVNSVVQAAIWAAGVGDFVTWVLMPGFESEADAASGPSRLIGGPVLQNKEKALLASPIHYVSSQSAPIIFFHGDLDEAVPVSQAVEMYVALERKGVMTELHILKGADHGGKGLFWSPEMFKQVDDFLGKAFAAKKK